MTKDSIKDRSLEDAKSSNTHFWVDNQRFSLIRRRSVFTRQSAAPRHVQKKPREPPIQAQPRNDRPYRRSTEASRFSDWPLSNSAVSRLEPPLPIGKIPISQARPSTPSECEYTHLGALKLGSLRVVNGAASPCSADTPVIRSRSSTYQHEQPTDSAPVPGKAGIVDHVKPRTSGSAFHLPLNSLATSALQTEPLDDVPGTPFSFEHSSSFETPRSRLSLASESGEEKMTVLDSGTLGRATEHPEHAAAEHDGRRESFPSDTVDSGYSSANSVHSAADKGARLSVDSLASLQRHPRYHGIPEEHRVI